MNDTKTTEACSCVTCPGANCACGCQANIEAEQKPCACGPDCKCGPSCTCPKS